MRENKRKIELAAEARPSLLIRHDQVGASDSVSVVFSVIVGVGVGGSGSNGEDVVVCIVVACVLMCVKLCWSVLLVYLILNIL